MIVNGRQQKLVARKHNGLWGVREARAGGLWVNESTDGWTTNLDFHGLTFYTKEAAEAYVLGYNAARHQVKEFIRGVSR